MAMQTVIGLCGAAWWENVLFGFLVGLGWGFGAIVFGFILDVVSPRRG